MENLKFNVFIFLNKSKKTTVPHLPLLQDRVGAINII